MSNNPPEKLTEQQVRHVAKLSRLRLSDQEIASYTERLSAVLEYVSKLNELDIEGVEPMAHATDTTNVLREDELAGGISGGTVGGALSVDQVLDNAPATSPPFFKVPKVLGQGPGA
jgi:aspartyl-tRNA(Asn)/glutamyl-tRNA(Gln) amidotransferase subunit C